ncbi:double-cubane-cluster-containing anaerobic reductase [Desulforhabdus amnigena]|jgi:benzoyl-CoA reductase/2-hydroxyglutaryl-CoA dehydratase subunit BcrC/BadD/HgdB|uniref:3-hydroxyacyl-ACP dehydratase n=1 Tax=Desulforhabdus amnigena TaxID=40218 RepID=A0A9W6FVM0_9BACT|nr:double-cubane-cluster-containing anaerobic reductase [Desulforhabdus amnigena]NLJ27040.1 2-hydroxyacyl-CoA dehydratase [Deltaproteobacteria bacterium]GLI35780.1 3-hydroxyacyl-ACP dehydratase [Desulforhabdus amnigena]
MPTPYDAMWEKLNLDLDAHAGLLSVLGKFYGDIYLTQQGRLKGMEYLDFVLSEVHGLRIQELQEAKAQGKKVIGTFCVFVPEELVLAADGIQVGLCAGAEAGKGEAEKILPRNTCALIKSFVGFKLSRLCPYIESSDLIVGETTCDGKKKAYEIFSDYAPVYVMEIPQMKNACDRDLWKAELLRFKEKIEEITGNAITAPKLREAIRKVNDRRRVLQRLNRLRANVPTPISGRDVLLINQISFYDDPDRFTAKIGELCDELESRIKAGEGIVPKQTPRLMLSGCPMAVPNWKLPYVIESSGAVIVGEESCIGTRNIRDLVSERAETLEEMLDAIADRYLRIDCACFTPNTERLDHISEMAKELNVDGVIHFALSFCQPYTMEAFKVEKILKEAGVPMLSIETDYSMEDVEQLKTRVEAFVEMVRK